MPGTLIHIREMLFNQPAFIHPDKAVAILAALQDRLELGSIAILPNQIGGALGVLNHASISEIQARGLAQGRRRESRTFHIQGGVAWIPVEGTLVNKAGSLDPSSGQTGYDGLAVKLREAVADPEVRGIFFDIDSAGGQVAGVFDLVDEIHAARSVKPVWAGLSDKAYSAAYMIASAANRVFIPQAGGLGSIGVLVLHADFSEQLANEGIRVTLIHSGKHKVDGHSFIPLADDARARVQTTIDGLREKFAGVVARGRGISAQAVLETEGLTYGAEESLRLGLADEIASSRDAFRRLAEEVGTNRSGAPLGAPLAVGPSDATTEDDMSGSGNDTAPAAEQVNEDTAPAATGDNDGGAATATDTINEATAAERSRVNGILSCEESEGRETLAKHLALNTAMTVDEAKDVLAASPKQEASRTSLADAMSTQPNPDLGTGDASGDDRGNPLVAGYSHATGATPRSART